MKKNNKETFISPFPILSKEQICLYELNKKIEMTFLIDL